MSAKIIAANKAETKRLIFESKGGILTPEESATLEEYLMFSIYLQTGSIDGKFCCAWGLVPPTLLADKAYLWMYSTDEVEQHKFLFVRKSQIAVEEMLKHYPILVGCCETGKTRSVRWLRWLGARFFEPVDPRYLPFEIRKR